MSDITDDEVIEMIEAHLRNRLTISVNEVQECGSADRVGDRRKFKIELWLGCSVISDTTFTI
jgi:hypothetical protein